MFGDGELNHRPAERICEMFSLSGGKTGTGKIASPETFDLQNRRVYRVRIAATFSNAF